MSGLRCGCSTSGIMMSPSQCEGKAEDCARLARSVNTPQMRVALSNGERAWIRLADQCARLEAFIKVMAENHPTVGIECAAEEPPHTADCPELTRMIEQ